MNTTPLLRLSGVTAPYGLTAPVDLEVQPASFTGLLGPNGAGKSTLVKLCAGALASREGVLEIEGQPADALDRRARARRIAYVPQEIGLKFEFSVFDAVAMGRHPHRGRLTRWRAEDQEAVEGALRDTRLLHLRDRSVRRLSGGERQRVALARALAQAPALLILDEPTAHLDMAQTEQTLALLDRAQRRGVAVLIALHDLNLAARYCHHLLLMRAGRIRARGRPDALLTEARLAEIFGAEVRIIPHPEEGCPQVLGRRPRGEAV